ncbi:MAG: PaaI family thioesterase [Actinobacteria bacterium]|nr:PaaI family thioesterase [Actinomycetota bacterium]
MEPAQIWREPFRGDYPDPRVLGFSGVESLQKGVEGFGPRPPMSHLIGLWLTEASKEHVVFTMPASEWFLSSQGQVSVGTLLMLADAALGCGVQIALPPATPYTTAELSMTFLAPCPAGGTLRATGGSLHDGRPLALSGAWIEDDNGRPVAHGTSTCYVFPAIEGLTPPDDMQPYVAPAYDTLDPHERPAPKSAIPWEDWKRMSGIEILRRQVDGELPPPPIHYLTGMTLQEVREGAATFTMPASEWLTSPLRTVQGGAIAMLGHAALATAVTSTLEVGSAYRPVDVKVNFLRPVNPGGELRAIGTVLHRGRTIAVASAEVFGADGKMVATATGSTMIVAER